MTVVGIVVGEDDSSCVETIFSYVSTVDCGGAARISFSSSTFTISKSFLCDSAGKSDESSESMDFSSEKARSDIVSLTSDAVRITRSSIP